MKKEIQNNLQKFRTDRHITQDELAQSVGVSRQTIISIEKGKYTPSLSLALELAGYFGIAVEDLFTLQ